MSMVRALRTLTALENGTLTGSQLETQLSGSTARRGEFAALCASEGAANRMAASAVTMAAVTASATAMAEFVKHTAARMAAWGSDNALNAIKSSATAMSACRAAGGYVVKSVPVSASYTPTVVDLSGRAYIVLGVSSLGLAHGITFSSVRGSSGMASVLTVDGSPDANGQDSSQATPISGQAVIQNNYGATTECLGVLRCDA